MISFLSLFFFCETVYKKKYLESSQLPELTVIPRKAVASWHTTKSPLNLFLPYSYEARCCCLTNKKIIGGNNTPTETLSLLAQI